MGPGNSLFRLRKMGFHAVEVGLIGKKTVENGIKI